MLYRRISYLQPYWKDQGLFDHAFNVTPLNIYGEERKIGEISLGLICANKQSREVSEIVSELQKINPDITTYPVTRDLNGKPVDMTEIDFKCINVGIKKVDTAIDYYYKVFKQYRALAKQFISITDGKIESHLLQSNGDALSIEHSHANYFTAPHTRHMVSELVDDDCSAQTKTRMIAQKAVKTAVATNSGISDNKKNSPFSL